MNCDHLTCRQGRVDCPGSTESGRSILASGAFWAIGAACLAAWSLVFLAAHWVLVP